MEWQGAWGGRSRQQAALQQQSWSSAALGGCVGHVCGGVRSTVCVGGRAVHGVPATVPEQAAVEAGILSVCDEVGGAVAPCD